MKISSQVINSAETFDIIAKALLLGFSRPDNMKRFTPQKFIDTVAVFGTTEASAAAYVQSAIKGKIPETICCVGADTRNNSFVSQHFTGMVLMLPELAYVSDSYADNLATRIAHLLEISSGHLPAPIVGYKDLHIVFAKQETEQAILGSLFEQFKTRLEQQPDVNYEITGEHASYGRRCRVIAGSCGVEPEKIVELDPHYVSNCLMFNRSSKNHYRVEPGIESVSFGEDFACFDASTLAWMFEQFNHQWLNMGDNQHSTTLNQRRKIYIHDKLAEILFEAQINMPRYFRPEHGVASMTAMDYSGDENRRLKTKEVRMKAIEFAKV